MPDMPVTTPAQDAISRSWQRCRNDGGYALESDPVMLARGDLSDRMDQHARLLAAARSEVDMLAGMVGRASSVVLLADASGTILQTAGCTDFLQRAEQVALRPGVSWSEDHRGTNAIGTALIEAAAVRVHGQEHYLRCNRVLSCNAAPIRSPRGELLGVLDISNDAGALHAYALGLASLCARQVTNRLIEQAAPRHGRRQLVIQRDAALLGGAERGLLVVDDDGRITAANDTALALLHTGWDELLDQPLGRWLEGWRGVGDAAGAIRGARGQALFAQWQTGPRPLAVSGAPAPAAPRPAAVAPAAVAPAASPPPAPVGVRSVAPEAEGTLPPLDAATRAACLRGARALDAGLSVLLLGETGAGKEVMARHLHAASHWGRGLFVAINCTALPETLIESELFGYEPGAFTGARRQGAKGRLREADGGVLFLDEIGDMPLALQARLLRALQERRVQPLGGEREYPVRFGVLAATHRPLAELVAQGVFRADLYYRLADYTVQVLPLRERADLADFIAAELAAHSRGALRLAPAARLALAAHPWPGNHRELRAVLRTLALFAPEDGEVHLDDLPATVRTAAPPARARAPLPATPRVLEPAQVAHTLAQCGGKVAQAARSLGVHRSTLYRHLRR